MSHTQFDLKSAEDFYKFLRQQKEQEQKQRLVLYTAVMEQLLHLPFVKGIVLKAPMFLFPHNSPMAIEEEYHIVFHQAPEQLEVLKEDLQKKWPAPAKALNYEDQKKQWTDELQEQESHNNLISLSLDFTGEKQKLQLVNREIMFEQFDSLIKPFRWFLEIYRGKWRSEVEGIKEAWEFATPKTAKLMEHLVEQYNHTGHPFDFGKSTFEFCQKEKMITVENFSSYQALCFAPIKEEYEQYLLKQGTPAAPAVLNKSKTHRI